MHTYNNFGNFHESIMKITDSPITPSFKDSHDKYFGMDLSVNFSMYILYIY